MEVNLNHSAANRNPICRDDLEAVNLLTASLSIAKQNFATIATMLSQFVGFKAVVDYVREHIDKVQKKVMLRRLERRVYGAIA